MVEKIKSSSSAKEHHSLLPLSVLWLESWNLFLSTLGMYGKLIGLAFLVIFLGGLLSILFSLPITFTSFGSPFAIFHHPTPFRIAVWILLGLWIVIYIFSLFILSFVLPFASIVALQNPKHFSMQVVFDRAKKQLPTYIGTLLLTFILLAGGWFLLLIPGLLFGIFFLFVPYIIILENSTGMNALRKSYLMVKQYFWNILLRIAMLGMLFLLGNQLIQDMSRGSVLLSFVGFLLVILFSWFAQAYMYILYQQVSSLSLKREAISIRWIWTVSLIGWILFMMLLVILVVWLNHVFIETPSMPQNTLPTV